MQWFNSIKTICFFSICRQYDNRTGCFVVKDSKSKQQFVVHGFKRLTTKLERMVNLDSIDKQEIATRTADILNSKHIPSHIFNK